MESLITYLIITWIAFSVGFVVGAAWCGLGRKNATVDRLFGRAQTCQWIPPTGEWPQQNAGKVKGAALQGRELN